MVNEKLELDSSSNNVVESNDNSKTLSKGNIIYVNSSADHKGDGSQKNPFQTLDDALNKSEDGDTIMIASGLYNGTKNTGLIIDTNNLKFIKYGDSEAIFDAENQRGIFDV